MTSTIPALEEISFSQKRALVRVDFNVPLDEHFHVMDDTRIRVAAPTLKKIIADGGSCVIMSHLGRPRGQPTKKHSLKHIIKVVEELLGVSVRFAPNCVGATTEKQAAALEPGEVLLLENLRFHKEEESGDITFAKKLSRLGEVYVNDAFGASHRAHSSIALVAQFFEKKCLGLAMHAELKHAKHVLTRAEKPFVSIIGGAKIADKMPMMDKLLDRTDKLIIGGGMAYTFCKAQGGNTGRSLVDYEQLGRAKALIQKARIAGVELILPVDSIVADRAKTDMPTTISDSSAIKAGYMGLDIGPEAQQIFSAAIASAKTILWNGPMGMFEIKKFEQGTKAMCTAVAEATDRGAFSLVGGGDSVAATRRFNLGHRMSHLSTGGGALLAYFAEKPLPALEALNS